MTYTIEVKWRGLSLSLHTQDRAVALRQSGYWMDAMLAAGQMSQKAPAAPPPPMPTLPIVQTLDHPIPVSLLSQLSSGFRGMQTVSAASAVAPADVPPHAAPPETPAANPKPAAPVQETLLDATADAPPSAETEATTQGEHGGSEIEISETTEEASLEATLATPPLAPQAGLAPEAVPSSRPVDDMFESVLADLQLQIAQESSARFPDASPAVEPSSPASTNPEEPDTAAPLEAPPAEARSFSDLTMQAKAETPEQLLLLAAYYLTFFEQQPRFPLKRINALITQEGLAPLSYGVLEHAISVGHLEMVPDLTGDAMVTEYSLSESGQLQARVLL
jgi:hypothetical protein